MHFVVLVPANILFLILSAKHEYSSGSAVGIDVTPARFVDRKVREALDPVVTDINGLFLTGQDTLLCGVTLAQVNLFYLIFNLYIS